MEIYWFSGSPFCWRALLALELKGIGYESKLLEASKKEPPDWVCTVSVAMAASPTAGSSGKR